MPGGLAIKHLNLEALAQPAIAPLGPMVQILDSIMALVGAVTGLKDALASIPPDPTKLAEAVSKVALVPQNLAGLMPMVAFPQMLGACIDIVVRALEDARGQVVALNAEMTALTDVENAARRLNAPRLRAVFECAQHNVRQEAVNLGKTMASVGSLIALIETIASLAQFPISVPRLDAFNGADLASALGPLENIIATFTTLRRAVPA